MKNQTHVRLPKTPECPCRAAPLWPRILLASSLLSVPVSWLHGQIVADGATNTLVNATTNITGDVTVGTNGSFTLLVLSDTALLTNSASGIIGLNSTAKSNEVRLTSASARWRVGVGGFLQFNGGTLSVLNSRVSNGTFFQIGNGISPATMVLAGNGLHEFTAILVATVTSNATLTGNGTIGGTVPLQLLAGSRLVPGASLGKMIFSNSPSLRGTVLMEISKNGAILTNDQIQVLAPLTYGGSLVISNLGPTALTVGDRFPLFTATSFAGSLSNIVLPPLASGLDWTNKLSVDGSIEVIALQQPAFASITLSGTNIVISGTNGPAGANYSVLTATNVALPLSNWVSIATNQFDSSGNFSITRPIVPGDLQRYFRVRIP